MASRNKVFNYVVVLKQKNRRSVELTGLMAALIFLVVLLHQLITTEQYRIFIGLITLATMGMLVQNLIYYRQRKKLELIILFIVAAASFLLLFHFPLMTVFYLILAGIYHRSVKPQEIGFSRENIVVDGLFQKEIPWSSLNNVILKDGLLTMDYKNNKLFQQETDELDDDEDDDVTEEEFNAFCRECLRH